MKKIIQKLHDEYENKYKEWCLANPGYVMCNYGTKVWILNTVLIDNLTFEQIVFKEWWYRDRYNSGKAHCYIPAETLKELIELINKENEKTNL